MAVQSVVTPANLGSDLDVGMIQPTKINVKRMVGASAGAAGAAGLAPAPAAGEQNEYLRGDGTWQPVPPTGVYGQVVMAGTFTAPVAYANVPGMSLALPSAGVYLINVNTYAANGGGGNQVAIRLFNATAGVVVADAHRNAVYGDVNTQTTGVINHIVTVAVPTTIAFQARSLTGAGIVLHSANGGTVMNYVKLA